MADTVTDGPAWTGNAETNPPPITIVGPLPPPTEIVFDVVNNDVAPFVVGMPIAKNRVRGDANNLLTAYIVGICVSGANPGFTAQIQCVGEVVLPTADWDARTGQVGGLTPNAIYYLGLAPGSLTTVAPIAGGEHVTIVGVALGVDTLVCSNPYVTIRL